MKQELRLENRITKLEVTVAEMGKDVKEIKDNHLVHLHNRIEAGGKIVVGILVALIINLIGVVISIALR